MPGSFIQPRRDQSAIRWATIAEWSGGTVHAGAEFVPMARGTRQASAPPPHAADPVNGAPPAATVDAVIDVLARHTASPERCLFGLWEGWGWIDWMADDLRAAARLEVPNRAYLLFEGPLEAVDQIAWRFNRDPDQALTRGAPNLIWPADRSWFVASEVDLDSTFVGGSKSLIDDLLADSRLEAWPASPADLVSADSDLINGPP
jgi:hypothetical protein